MRVLMYGWEFPPHNAGGLGVACLGLSRALAGLGIDLMFVLPVEFSVYAPWMKVRFGRAPSFGAEALTGSHSAYQSNGGDVAVTTRAVKSIKKVSRGSIIESVFHYAEDAYHIAKEEMPDIIHVHDWLCIPAGLAAKAACGVPLIIHIHATEFDRTGGNSLNQQVYAIEREGFERADRLIAVSEYTKRVIVEKYGISPEKISVVHNAIDPDMLEGEELPPALIEARAQGYKVVLFVGRLTLQKGPDYFITVAREVLAHRDKVLFLIAGSGDMERSVIEMAAGAGIGSKVLFAGFRRGNEMAQLFRAADVLIMPSVSEPFGIVPLEAAAYGVPVIISRQSGVAERLLHALRSDFWDVRKMANDVIAVLDHPPLRGMLQQKARAQALERGWRHAAEECIGVYRTVVY